MKKRGHKKKNKKNHRKHPILRFKGDFWDKASDILTEFVGSWGFILGLIFFMIIWMSLNAIMIKNYKWDPYPYILLNFALSTIAAITTPIILMSQNRQAKRDRLTAKYDYQVNKKAEREIQDMQKDLDEIKKLIKKNK